MNMLLSSSAPVCTGLSLTNISSGCSSLGLLGGMLKSAAPWGILFVSLLLVGGGPNGFDITFVGLVYLR